MSTFRGLPVAQMVKALRDFATRLERDEAMVREIAVTVNRPPRELNAALGECPHDGYRHYAAGSHETWSIEVNYVQITEEERVRDFLERSTADDPPDLRGEK
jgi:hypothetical protein